MYDYEVTQNRYISPTVTELTMRATRSGQGLTFDAGQYVSVSFRRRSRPTPARCFSITSSSTDPDVLQVAVRVGGDFTQALAELAPGAQVKVRGAFGDFILYDDYDSLALLAGGIGITPFMSMLRYATAIKWQKNITLLYSCQTQDDVPFARELLALEQQNPYLRVVFIIGRGDTSKLASPNIVSGRLSPGLIRQVTGNRASQFGYYICGPKGFMKAAGQHLAKQAVPKDQILTEAFSQSKTSFLASFKGRSINSVSYGLTASAMLVLAGAFMMTDLLKTIPRASAATQSSAATSSVLPSASSQPSDSSSPTATQPTGPATASTPLPTLTPTPRPTQQPQTSTYQAPVTAVS
jgi:ferredoxin-NADP reductase